MGYAKVKGNLFENTIAKIIHTTLMYNIPQYKTIVETVDNKETSPKRDSSSGASKESLGDISLGVGKKYFPYSLECKNHKDLDLSLNVIFKYPTKIFKIWESQVLVQADRAKLYPLMAFKANRTLNYLLFDINKLPFELNLSELAVYFRYSDFIVCEFEEFMRIHILNFKAK